MTPDSAPQTTKLQRLVSRILKRLEADSADPRYVGGFAFQDDAGIDDGGGYGDPMIDENKPDFVREDERGWIPLKPR